MVTFEDEMRTLTAPGDDRRLPGAVMLSCDFSGKEIYHKCFGTSSIEPDKARPLTRDSIFWIASCTKLLTSISALQLVEKGLVKLDDPISAIIPEMANPDIITSFNDDGSPNLVNAKNPITLRHLITHTSGMAYDFLHPNILAWWKWRGVNPQDYAGDIKNFYGTPLVFEPGTSWTYSPGLDWAGILISRLTNVSQLGDHFKSHIFAPLGILQKDAGFRQSDLHLSETEHAERWGHLTIRLQPDESANVFKPGYEGKLAPFPPIRTLEPKDDMGGGGLMTTPSTYIKVLTSILCNDGKLLKPETVNNMLFSPAIGSDSRTALLGQMVPEVGGRMFTGGLPLPGDATADGQQEYHHGLCGLLNRPKGSSEEWSLSWSGLPNLFWWINRTAGLCGHYAGQLIPPGDPLSLDMGAKFRLEMEKRFGKQGSAEAAEPGEEKGSHKVARGASGPNL